MDYEKYYYNWIQKISLTISEFLVTCNDKNYGNIIMFIVRNPPEICEHRLEYECLTEENVPPNHIIHRIVLPFTQHDIVLTNSLHYLNDRSTDKLISIIHKFITKYKKIISNNNRNYNYEDIKRIMDSLYIHITCSNFEESIVKYGLLHNSGYKIGDAEEEEQEREEEEEYMPEIEIFFGDEDVNFNGGKKLIKYKSQKCKCKTRKNNNRTKGWKQQKPGYHQRTVMLKKCGKKCFLGSKKRFPICKKNTCKISRQGVQSAYIRAKQFKHSAIARKAKSLLRKMKK